MNAITRLLTAMLACLTASAALAAAISYPIVGTGQVNLKTAVQPQMDTDEHRWQ